MQEKVIKIHIKRAYEKAVPEDGLRVLVDRLWPRGVSRKAARIDLWLKGAAPSSKLRTWFHADKTGRLKEFHKRYAAEIRKAPEMAELRKMIMKNNVTLVTAVKDFENSHISVLAKKLGSKARRQRKVPRVQSRPA